MKKLMFYINALHHGGAERVIAYLANRFSQKEYECIMVTSIKEPWEYPLVEQVKRVTVFEEGMPKNFVSRNFRAILRLRQLIDFEKPDLIISFMAEPNFRALVANIGKKSKSLISVRNDPNMEYPNLLFKLSAKLLYPLADGIVFQTRDAKQWFSKSIQDKSKIILNPVEEVFFNTPLKEVRKGIVTTGRLVEQKNHALLIKAFAKIANQVEDDLYIYGEGELKEELLSLINNLGLGHRIHLPGAVKNVPEVLSGAKLFVLSSDYEGMPNSLMEAMAMGLPCISTDCPCGGPRRLLKSDMLIRINNEIELSEKMLEVVVNEQLKINNEKINRDLSLSYTTNSIINIWDGYISDILEEK